MLTLLRVIIWPTKLGVKSGYRVGRLIGFRRLAVFGAGVAVGLMVAPVTGRELRGRIGTLVADQRARGPKGDLAERVRNDLARSPRTWHLPQPEVEVVGDRAVLRGHVPHEAGRADLERTASAVAGVADVDNQVGISGTNGHG